MIYSQLNYLLGVSKKELVVNTLDVEVTRIYSATNMLLKYNWHFNPMNEEVVMDLELQSVRKYRRRMYQIADELSHLQDYFPAIAVFVNEVCRNYNQKMELDKCLRFRQDKDYQWMSSYYIKLYTFVQCWKIDRKDFANMSIWVKKYVLYSLV